MRPTYVLRLLLVVACLYSLQLPLQAQQEAKKFVTETGYLLFLPEGYKKDDGKKWPLMLFLHGSGERGTVLDSVKKHGPPKIVETQKDFPFILISPQCPPNQGWHPPLLDALLEEVIQEHNVDTERMYLTGLSMGGYGTWEYATMYPNRFAAIVPICGGGDPAKVWSIRNLPIWVFHGAKDQAVPIKQSEDMVNALKNVGNNAKFTVYPEAGHDSWTVTYNNPELYQWLLSHKKKERLAVEVDPKIFDKYVGKYEFSPQFIFTVTKERDHLYGQASGQPKVELLPETEKDYFIKEADIQFTFVTDNKGKATELILYQNGERRAKRLK
ncbi:prolyl oligopeptidase family serine peptidase [Rhodocytophaga aerolata]|uniref:Prolyl oligopeptidase family serine peptidase n=1 Tax=Rhodocytophaga aerolata TaxID=455078 RepID=A0ABT8R429_9BACT|nr:prolyl oligopeptidase family serine peptidase [Rhodocytophaga aerolata]MDO1446033.1 prolyl oligopeptidase family serine peptidase [Rhodocytophaga aerolata]